MFSLSQMAERFEKLLGKLPSPIRTPVEREWQPLKELFLQRRPARVALIGGDADAYLRTLLPEDTRYDFSGPWLTAQHPKGALRAITVCKPDSSAAAIAAIAAEAPDLFLLVGDAGEEWLRMLETLHRNDRERYNDAAPIVATGDDPSLLSERLFAHPAFSSSVLAVVPIAERDTVLAAIARALPGEARLEFARLTGERLVQHEIARTLTRSAAAVCTAVGAQPIPLADLPVLTALQGVMLAGIVTASGREMNPSTIRDFLGAMGVNVGAAFVLREGARAVAKFFPGWGNIISGAVAGAGTYAVGMAATAYFIDGLPIEEVRKRLKLAKKKTKALK